MMIVPRRKYVNTKIIVLFVLIFQNLFNLASSPEPGGVFHSIINVLSQYYNANSG
jgi:hypothetical protein